MRYERFISEEDAVKLYLEGTTVLDIAEKMYRKKRFGFQQVYYLLRKNGVYKYRENVKDMHKREVVETYFDVIDSEDKAYLLGFIAADGYVDERRNSLKVGVNQRDIDILEKIRDRIGPGYEIKKFTKDDKYQHCSIDIHSKRLVSSLKGKGLYQGKSLTMTEECFTHVPDTFKVAFLRGYFDGDGCMTLGAKYSSGIKYLIQIVGTEKFLAETFCKMFPTTCKMHKYKSCNMYCYKLSSKRAVLEFLKKLYDNSSIHLNRKYHNYWAHVKSGELLEPCEEKSSGDQQPNLCEPEGGSETIETA